MKGFLMKISGIEQKVFGILAEKKQLVCQKLVSMCLEEQFEENLFLKICFFVNSFGL